MQRQEAIKKLSKLLGKSFGYRIDDKALPRDGREIAKAALSALQTEVIRLERLKDERAKMLLGADAEYQLLLMAYQKARKQRDVTAADCHRQKITVGTRGDLFFTVKAQGDSWEEIFAKLNSK